MIAHAQIHLTVKACVTFFIRYKHGLQNLISGLGSDLLSTNNLPDTTLVGTNTANHAFGLQSIHATPDILSCQPDSG